MINQDFPFTRDLSEKHVHKITFNRLWTILQDWQNSVGGSLWPGHDKVMIQLWHSPELSMSAPDINTGCHGNPSLNEEKGEHIPFSLKSTCISLNSHLQTD